MESMNPQQQLPPNYLDEIAPQAVKRSFALGRTRMLILFGILAIVVIGILVAVANQIGASRTQPWERLAARLATTNQIAVSSEGKIKNSQLRSTNSNVKITLTNTQRDLATPLATIGINSQKLTPSVVSAESGKDMLARLEDARLNAKYDSTYAREMSFQLANLLTLLRQLYSSSSNVANKSFLQTTYDNIAPVQKSLSEFSASNE
jgi:signal transduction histidine kinase